MADEQAQVEAALEKARLSVRKNMIKLQDAIESSNLNAQSVADANIAAAFTSASQNIPESISPSKRAACRKTLSGAAAGFRGNSRSKKMEILASLSKWIGAARNLKAAGTAAGGLGLLALGCLCEKHTWLMTNGEYDSGFSIPLDNGRETLAWDQNHNGIVDHQETIDTFSGQVVDPPSSIGWGDGFEDMVHGVGNFLSDLF